MIKIDTIWMYSMLYTNVNMKITHYNNTDLVISDHSYNKRLLSHHGQVDV